MPRSSGGGETGEGDSDESAQNDGPLYLADIPDQSGGPVVIGGPRKTEFFHLGQIEPATEVRYRYEHDTIEPKTGANESFTENRFEEDLSVKTTGYIIHPNLVDMKLSGTFGLRQDLIDNDGRGSYGRETIYDYDANATILRKEEAPITLYSRRTSDLISRQFGASFDNTITTSGGIIDWRNKQVPIRVEVYHSDQDQTSLDQSESYTLSQNVANLHTDFEPFPHQRMAVNYTFSAVDETNQSFGGRGSRTNSFVTNDVDASHSWEFGPTQQHNLSSSISYFDQTGDFPFERLRVNELLRLKHSDAFETRYRYTLDHQSSNFSGLGLLDQTQHTFDSGFIHRLYKSLVTSGDAGIRELDRSDNSGLLEYFANINFDYHKQVPLGALALNTGYAFDRQENRAQRTVTHIVNESRTFNDPLPIIISGTNILPASLVVRSANAIIIFTEGLDYLVRVFTDRVEIERVIGGRIANGQAVLISYDLSPQAANTTTNNTYSLSVRYDIDHGPLKGLAVYGRYTRLLQDIESQTSAAFIPNSFEDIVGGSEYRFWEFTLGAEEQFHHSTIAPYDATRFFGRFQHRLALETTLLASANYTVFRYSEEHDHVNLINMAASVAHRFTTNLTGSASLTYLNQRDARFGTTSGIDGTMELRWTIRQTSIFAQFRQAILDTTNQTNTYQTVYLGLRREF